MKARATTKKILEVLDLSETLTLDSVKRLEDRRAGFEALYKKGFDNSKDLYQAALAYERWSESVAVFVQRRVLESKEMADLVKRFGVQNLSKEEQEAKNRFQEITRRIRRILETLETTRNIFFVNPDDSPYDRENPEGFDSDQELSNYRVYDKKTWDKILMQWQPSSSQEYGTPNDNPDAWLRMIKDLFKAIESFFVFVGGDSPSLQDSYKFHKYRLGSFLIKLIYEEGDEEQRKAALDLLNKVKKVVEILKSNGVDRLLARQVSFAIDATSYDMRADLGSMSVGGFYQPFTDLLVTRVDEIRNLLHEFGHRYYYQIMSKAARVEWTDSVRYGFDQGTPLLTEKQTDALLKYWKKAARKEGSWLARVLRTRESPDIATIIVSDLWDRGSETVLGEDSIVLLPRIVAKLKYNKNFVRSLLDYNSKIAKEKDFEKVVGTKAKGTSDIVPTPKMVSEADSILDVVKAEIGKLVVYKQEKISDYRKDSPNEQFAEAFADYCLDKTTLSKPILNFLSQELK
jgi:hypothetical protein